MSLRIASRASAERVCAQLSIRATLHGRCTRRWGQHNSAYWLLQSLRMPASFDEWLTLLAGRIWGDLAPTQLSLFGELTWANLARGGPDQRPTWGRPDSGDAGHSTISLREVQ